MQKSFWWWQCSGRYIFSLFPHLHTPFPFSPSLISLLVSVDVKHHVYLQTAVRFRWWYRALCPRMSVDILGTNCDQCLSMVQYCFTSTKTIRLIRTESPGRPPRLSHSSELWRRFRYWDFTIYTACQTLWRLCWWWCHCTSCLLNFIVCSAWLQHRLYLPTHVEPFPPTRTPPRIAFCWLFECSGAAKNILLN